MFDIDTTFVERITEPKGRIPMRSLKVGDEFVQDGITYRLDTDLKPFGELTKNDRCIVGNTWYQVAERGSMTEAVMLSPPDFHFGEPDNQNYTDVPHEKIVPTLTRRRLS